MAAAYGAGLLLMAFSVFLLPPLLWRWGRCHLWVAPICALVFFLAATLPLMLTSGQGSAGARIATFLRQDWILSLILPALLLLLGGVLYLVLVLCATHSPPRCGLHPAGTAMLFLLCIAPTLVIARSLLGLL